MLNWTDPRFDREGFLVSLTAPSDRERLFHQALGLDRFQLNAMSMYCYLCVCVFLKDYFEPFCLKRGYINILRKYTASLIKTNSYACSSEILNVHCNTNTVLLEYPL